MKEDRIQYKTNIKVIDRRDEIFYFDQGNMLFKPKSLNPIYKHNKNKADVI